MGPLGKNITTPLCKLPWLQEGAAHVNHNVNDDYIEIKYDIL